MKKLFLILVAGLITGTLLIGLMEGFVRLAIPDHEIYPHPRGLYTTSPTIGYVLTPGFRGAAITREYHTTLAINAWGARGPEITTKQEGELRIIGLGDSFTFAQQLPIRDTFLKVCERQLRANQPAGRTVDILNAGVNGYGTVHEIQLLRERYPQWQPDVVIIQFFDNDLVDNLIAEKLGTVAYRVVRDGYLHTESDAGQATRLPAAIRTPLRRLESYSYLKQRFHVLLNMFRGTHDLGVYAPALSRDLQRGWNITRQLYQELGEWCASRDILLLALYIPAPMAMLPELRATYGNDAASLDWERPAREFAGIMEQLGIPTVNGYQYLENADATEPLYFLHDGHLTARGARVIGEALAKSLTEKALWNRQ